MFNAWGSLFDFCLLIYSKIFSFFRLSLRSTRAILFLEGGVEEGSVGGVEEGLVGVVVEGGAVQDNGGGRIFSDGLDGGGGGGGREGSEGVVDDDWLGHEFPAGVPDSRLFRAWSGGVDDDNIGQWGVEGGGGVVDEGGAV